MINVLLIQSPSPITTMPPTHLPLVTISLFSVVKNLFLGLSLFPLFMCFLNSTYDWNHMVFPFLWLTSLSIILLCYISVVSNGKMTFFFKFISLFWEREHKRVGEQQRERERQNPKQAPAVSAEPNVGLKLMNSEIMIRAEIKSQMLNQLSHPGAPKETLT